MDSIWEAGSQALGSTLGFIGQERANRQNLDMWRKEQDWQTFMSNTAVQRRTADMKAAGINPILAAGSAAGGGSTSPPRMENSLKDVASSAISTKRMFADLEQMQKQNAKLSADTELSKAQAEQARALKNYYVNSAKKVDKETTAIGGTRPFLFGSVLDALRPENVAKVLSKGSRHSAASLRDFHD